MTYENMELRKIVAQNGFTFKQIAIEMNITRTWLAKLMRKPLSAENRLRIMGAIERLKAEQVKRNE